MAQSDRPNVLFLLTDDQRFDMIGALGNSAVRTPNLDRLVARGTSFTRAHIMGGSCPAVCMPSRAMLHTGRTLYHLDRQGQDIPHDHVLLGEHLRRAGYSTWVCGKWHNGHEALNRAFGDGDEIYFGGMCDHWNVPAYRYDPTGRYDSRIPYCVDPMAGKELGWREADHIHAGKHSSELLADAAVERLGDTDANDQPWFMYVSLLAPHDPRTMPDRFQQMYSPDQIELPENFVPVHPFDNGELRVRDERLASFPRTEAETRQHLADYYAMITHLDHELGRVLAALEASGQAENTLVVFAGDNGLAVGQHGLMGKQSLYDHSLRVPLIFAGPGVPAGEQRGQLCYLLDIFPTLCDLLGLDIPASVDGRSLAPAMRSRDDAGRDHLYFAYRHLMRGIRNDRYKLIEYAVDGRRRTQLFDLQEDPAEIRDLAADPQQQSILDELRSHMLRWRQEADDDQAGQGADFWACYDSAHVPIA